jgi:hypothetical protein
MDIILSAQGSPKLFLSLLFFPEICMHLFHYVLCVLPISSFIKYYQMEECKFSSSLPWRYVHSPINIPYIQNILLGILFMITLLTNAASHILAGQ